MSATGHTGDMTLTTYSNTTSTRGLPKLPLPITFDLLLKPDPLCHSTLCEAWRFEYSSEEHCRKRVEAQNRVVELMMTTAKEGHCEKRLKLTRALQGQQNRHGTMVLMDRLWRAIKLNDPDTPELPKFEPSQYLSSWMDREAPLTGLRDALVKSRKKMEAANDWCTRLGFFANGLCQYMHALAVLCPYTCDASFMTFDEARNSGLQEHEELLFLNISAACTRIATLRKEDMFLMYEQKKTNFYAHCAKVSLAMAKGTPFATFCGLRKRHAITLALYASYCDLFTSEEVSELRMEVEYDKVYAKKNQDAWAHGKCVGTHVCTVELPEDNAEPATPPAAG